MTGPVMAVLNWIGTHWRELFLAASATAFGVVGYGAYWVLKPTDPVSVAECAIGQARMYCLPHQRVEYRVEAARPSSNRIILEALAGMALACERYGTREAALWTAWAYTAEWNRQTLWAEWLADRYSLPRNLEGT